MKAGPFEYAMYGRQMCTFTKRYINHPMITNAMNECPAPECLAVSYYPCTFHSITTFHTQAKHSIIIIIIISLARTCYSTQHVRERERINLAQHIPKPLALLSLK